MKETLIKLYNKTITKVLTALGFCTTFVFMACYGAPPTDYNLVDEFEDGVVGTEVCDSDSIMPNTSPNVP